MFKNYNYVKAVLNMFKNIRLGFKLFKLFIVYLVVHLLSFIVNSFNIIITNKHVVAICKIA